MSTDTLVALHAAGVGSWVAAEYPLASAAAAHRRLRSRVVGRIVLRIRRRSS